MKAFPSNGFYEKTGGGEQPQKLNPVMGMDLRDYFAAQAMLVVICSNYKSTAEYCYKLADEMMKARSE